MANDKEGVVTYEVWGMCSHPFLLFFLSFLDLSSLGENFVTCLLKLKGTNLEPRPVCFINICFVRQPVFFVLSNIDKCVTNP